MTKTLLRIAESPLWRVRQIEHRRENRILRNGNHCELFVKRINNPNRFWGSERGRLSLQKNQFRAVRIDLFRRVERCGLFDYFAARTSPTKIGFVCSLYFVTSATSRRSFFLSLFFFLYNPVRPHATHAGSYTYFVGPLGSDWVSRDAANGRDGKGANGRMNGIHRLNRVDCERRRHRAGVLSDIAKCHYCGTSKSFTLFLPILFSAARL